MELGMLIACVILATIALVLSIISIVMQVARDKATHTVQMIPVDEEINRANEEFMKKWATSEEAIQKQNKLYKEDLEEKMPEFALEDEDKEIFSI